MYSAIKGQQFNKGYKMFLNQYILKKVFITNQLLLLVFTILVTWVYLYVMKIIGYQILLIKLQMLSPFSRQVHLLLHYKFKTQNKINIFKVIIITDPFHLERRYNILLQKPSQYITARNIPLTQWFDCWNSKSL